MRYTTDSYTDFKIVVSSFFNNRRVFVSYDDVTVVTDEGHIFTCNRIYGVPSDEQLAEDFPNALQLSDVSSTFV